MQAKADRVPFSNKSTRVLDFPELEPSDNPTDAFFAVATGPMIGQTTNVSRREMERKEAQVGQGIGLGVSDSGEGLAAMTATRAKLWRVSRNKSDI